MTSSRIFEKIEKVKSLASVIRKKLSLFKFTMNENHELSNESYVLYDRVMDPLGAQQEQVLNRNDIGTEKQVSNSLPHPQP
ncbi:hypothetical protein Tco_1015523 [Tanacetum coccineum]|uniref:Uncharacterized protein n=1 Tax=Tanacetum coccineum TaxID=301880 RepID=A0ABQ5FM57_9ASTR